MADFEVVREIGKGGMGTVFLARQLSTGRHVAVKTLPKTMSIQAGGRERFQREIKALGSVNHPNVVRVYAAGEDGGCLFYAMELIEGETLAAYVERNELGEKDILKLFLQVCDGVSAMHQAGIIHRDLKPTNILVDGDGVPRIVDLGLALFVEEEGDHPGQISVTTPYLGTPAFMAPEQCGNGECVDVRTDVYSLGGVLYLLLLGVLPYPIPKDPLKAIEVIRTRPPTRPAKLVKNFSSDLETVLLKALAKSPVDRYAAVADFAADIENVRRFRPVTARAPSRLYIARKFSQRNWRPLTAVSAWVFVIIFVAVYAFINVEHARIQAVSERDAAIAARQGEAEARRALAREAYYKSISIVRQRLAGGRLREAAQLLRATPEGARGWEWGRLMRLANPQCFTWNLPGPIAKIQPLLDGGKAVIRHGNVFSLVNKTGHVLASAQAPQALGDYAVCPADGTVVWVEKGGNNMHAFTLKNATHPDRIPEVIAEALPDGARQGGRPKVAFDDKGRYLVRIQASLATLFSWPDGHLVRSLQLKKHVGEILAAGVSQTGKMAWIEQGSVNPQLIVEQVETERNTLITVDDKCRLLAIRTDGRFVASGTETGVKIRDAKYGHYTPRINGGATERLAFSPNGSWLAAQVGGVIVLKPVIFKEADAEAELGETVFRLEDQNITSLAFSPDSSVLLVGDGKGCVRGFPICRELACDQVIEGSLLAVSAVSLLRVSNTDMVVEYTLRDRHESVRIRPDFPAVNQAAFCENGARLALVSEASPVIEVYDTRTGVCRCLVNPFDTPVVNCLLTDDGERCMVTDQRGYLVLFDVSTGKVIRSVEKTTSSPYALASDGGTVLFGQDGNSLHVLSVGRGDEKTILSMAGVEAACFSRDSRMLALAREEDVMIIDVSSGENISVLQPLQFSGDTGALAFSPSGKRLIVGETRGASVWNPMSGNLMLSGIEPKEPVSLIRFLADGRLLIGGRTGGNLLLGVVE